MKKYTVSHFAAGDFKTVECYLNRQAEQGWELEKLGLCFARWRKTQRRDLRWCVDLANPRENNDRAARKDYIDLCAEGGWELLTLRGGMYFFRSMPGRNPPPVQTDPEMEHKNYNRYYIRHTILSAIYTVAFLVIYAALCIGTSSDLGYAMEVLRQSWQTHWMALGLAAALPLWAVWAVWRLMDFVRAVVSGRRGAAGAPPRAVMWINCWLGTLNTVGTALFCLGLCLECVLQADLIIYLFILPLVWAGTLLFRGFLDYDFQLYPGELRTIRTLGFCLLALSVGMIALRAALPFGDWTLGLGSRDSAEAAEVYALLEEAPLITGEELGIAAGDDSGYLDLETEYTPMGRRWYAERITWKNLRERVTCESILCPTGIQADSTMKRMLRMLDWWSDEENREGLSSGLAYLAPPMVELTETDISWADSAWYGQGEGGAILVLRVGRQVTCLTAPEGLLTEELLSVLRERLCP